MIVSPALIKVKGDLLHFACVVPEDRDSFWNVICRFCVWNLDMFSAPNNYSKWNWNFLEIFDKNWT